MLADSVGLALLVVLETLTPAERLAFVLHDMFAMPFDEIAADRRPHTGRQRASSRAALAGASAARTPSPMPTYPAARGRRRLSRRISVRRLRGLVPYSILTSSSAIDARRGPPACAAAGRGRRRGCAPDCSTAPTVRASRTAGARQRRRRCWSSARRRPIAVVGFTVRRRPHRRNRHDRRPATSWTDWSLTPERPAPSPGNRETRPLAERGASEAAPSDFRQRTALLPEGRHWPTGCRSHATLQAHGRVQGAMKRSGQGQLTQRSVHASKPGEASG